MCANSLLLIIICSEQVFAGGFSHCHNLRLFFLAVHFSNMVIGLVSPSVLSRIKYLIKYCVECNIQGPLRMNHTDN